MEYVWPEVEYFIDHELTDELKPYYPRSLALRRYSEKKQSTEYKVYFALDPDKYLTVSKNGLRHSWLRLDWEIADDGEEPMPKKTIAELMAKQLDEDVKDPEGVGVAITRLDS